MLFLLSDQALYTVWGLSLGIAVVVLLVVAGLLTLIARSAERILTGVNAIWVGGQRIANNTIHIDLLRRTNETAAGILDAAGGIALASSRIEQHAESCPSCPMCAMVQRL
ncbi:MAG: hypothetical protein ABI939_09605 [Anaerolineaceae bacterium]